jgi:hypothetical protein
MSERPDPIDAAMKQWHRRTFRHGNIIVACLIRTPDRGHLSAVARSR